MSTGEIAHPERAFPSDAGELTSTVGRLPRPVLPRMVATLPCATWQKDATGGLGGRCQRRRASRRFPEQCG
jgi:hypothetical protein